VGLLGCLNHALLTPRRIEARGLKLAGWVGNSVDPEFERREANTETLRSRLAQLLGIVPHAPNPARSSYRRRFCPRFPNRSRARCLGYSCLHGNAYRNRAQLFADTAETKLFFGATACFIGF